MMRGQSTKIVVVIDLPLQLAEAAESLRVSEASLRCECANLETVYVSVEDGQLVAHDHCETYAWLDTHGGTDGRAWSESDARAACGRFNVELTTSWSDHPDEAMSRIQRLISDGDNGAEAVQAVASAIDAVFAAHGPTRRARGSLQ
jgi:tricorn protease-like protein